jgi:hypothetical protein
MAESLDLVARSHSHGHDVLRGPNERHANRPPADSSQPVPDSSQPVPDSSLLRFWLLLDAAKASC